MRHAPRFRHENTRPALTQPMGVASGLAHGVCSRRDHRACWRVPRGKATGRPRAADGSTVSGWRPHGLAVLGRHTREVTCVKRGVRADVRATRVRVIVDVVPEDGVDPRMAQAEAYRLAATVCDRVAEAEGWLAADPVVRVLERGARVTVTGHDSAATVARF